MSDKPECILFGVGTPYVYEVYESLLRDGIAVRAFVDNLDRGLGPRELGPVTGTTGLPEEWKDLPLYIPLLTPGHRKVLLAQAKGLGFARFPAHCDPTAVMASTAIVEDGVLVNALATIGAMTRIGPFCIVNRSASIGHHVVLEPFATLGPGCILCGSTAIGTGTFVGAGAVINPKVKVGRNSIVGAGAVVVRDLGDHVVAVGNPARVVKDGVAGYNDVSV
jgi:sugar O-acyltransferase (sialic acid O-acetyltransferase NeuD family)